MKKEKKKTTSRKHLFMLTLALSLIILGIFSVNATTSLTWAKSAQSKETATADTEKTLTKKEANASTLDFTLDDLPEYTTDAYTVVNDNVPGFTDSELTTQPFEYYSSLDKEGRCDLAYANVCEEIMPTESRGEIGSVKPTGWHTVKYDCVDGRYLYNRCHLIGYQLSGENANDKNLITGTRYMNVDGMLPFENLVDDYVEETGNHVLYRVTPIFEEDNLLASGVLMEAKSVEDKGEGVEFCVYCYNTQPAVDIDYETGDSSWDGEYPSAEYDDAEAVITEDKTEDAEPTSTPTSTPTTAPTKTPETTETASSSATYIINVNTGKFHYPNCASVKKMSDKNKQEFTGSRDQLIAQGYEACQNCKP